MQAPKKELEVYETEDPVETPGLGKVFTKKASDIHTANSVLDQSAVPPREAFLSFQQGKLTQETDPDVRRFYHRNLAIGGSRRVRPEDPLTKFNRLQAELSDLQNELREMSADDKESKDLFTSVKKQEAVELSHSAQVLMTQLEQLGQHDSYKPFLASSFDGNSAIASQQLLSKLNEMKESEKAAEPAAGTKGPDGAGGAGGLTYELFYNQKLQRAHGHSSLNSLENRLYQLEQMVGLKTLDVSSAGKPSPLSDVVAKLEERVKLLDDSTLQRLQQKMAKLNAEFEAFTAARNEAKAPRVALHDDIQRERVDSLFNTVQQWAPVADTIPTLIGRFQTLKSLHEESALFTQRLYGLETMQEGLQNMLQAAEKALDNVQSHLGQNQEIFLENVEGINKRLDAVSAAME